MSALQKLKRHPGYFLLFVFAIISLLFCIYFYVQYQVAQYLLTNPTAKTQIEIQQTINKVSRLIVLPDETPTIATVTDINKLHGQSFFLHAKNGDKVLLFQQAKEAILYDPDIDKLVNVGPINVMQTSPTPSALPRNNILNKTQ